MRLWPAVRSARLFATEQEYRQYRLAEPWRVRASDRGEGAVVGAWRSHLDVLAIRGLWCSTDRLALLLDEIKQIASDHGFHSLLSPLLPRTALQPYLDSGFRIAEPLVVLQAPAEQLASLARAAQFELREASGADVTELATIDSWCFDSFWRYGPSELEEAVRAERVIVACDGSGSIAGYVTTSHHGATVTVGRLAVAPEHRRAGVATTLLGDCARWALQTGALGVTLCTQDHNQGSRALYRHAGMRQVGENYALAVVAVRLSSVATHRVRAE